MILLCAIILASIVIALFMRRKKRGIIVHCADFWGIYIVYSYCEKTLKCDLLNELFVNFLPTSRAATEAA